MKADDVVLGDLISDLMLFPRSDTSSSCTDCVMTTSFPSPSAVDVATCKGSLWTPAAVSVFCCCNWGVWPVKAGPAVRCMDRHAPEARQSDTDVEQSPAVQSNPLACKVVNSSSAGPSRGHAWYSQLPFTFGFSLHLSRAFSHFSTFLVVEQHLATHAQCISTDAAELTKVNFATNSHYEPLRMTQTICF